MVKLHHSEKIYSAGMVRGKPRPLFPPGDLPLFGPPPAYMRRGPPIPPPQVRGPMPPLGFGPPMRFLRPMRPPPPPPARHSRHPGPVPLPLLQNPLPRPMGPPFFGRRGPPNKPMHGRKIMDKRRLKANKRSNKRNKIRRANRQDSTQGQKENSDLLTGPWINESIKAEITKMEELKTISDKSKEPTDVENYDTQKKKVEEIANAAKTEHLKTLPEQQEPEQNQQPEQKLLEQPENTSDDDQEFYCESCDKSFDSEEDLENHLMEHIVCGREGCTFSAHPKVIDIHVKFTHLTGVYNRMAKSQDADQNWIAERKKNYPTKEKIMIAEEEKAEKIERGEVLEEKSWKKKPKVKRKWPKKKKVTSYFNTDDTLEIIEGLPPLPEENVSTMELDENDIVDSKSYNESISDDEWQNNSAENEVNKSVCSVLSALCEAYGSDSEVEMEEKVEPVVTYDMDEEAPSEAKITKLDETPNFYVKEDTIKTNNKKRKIEPKNKDDKKNLRVTKIKPKTLLEKLLGKEILKERNHILQCIRYIINQNYFENKK